MFDFTSITEKNIDLYGSRVTLRINDNEYKTSAFIQPLRYKNKMYVDGYFLPQGYVDGGHFLYIGKVTPKFTNPLEDNLITLDKTKEEYIVKRVETFRVCDEDVYIWAIITPKTKIDLEV